MAEEMEEGDFEFRSRVEEELEYFTDLALNETQRWIEAITRHKFAYPDDPRKSLENGVLLCTLLNSIKPGCIKRINKLHTPIAGLDNLNVFLRACEEHFGLRGAQLFDPGDLQDLSNRAIAETELIKQEVDRRLRNVCITIYWLGRAVVQWFTGPKLDLSSFGGLITGFVGSISPHQLEHKYEKHYTQTYYQEHQSKPSGHGRQASSDSLDFSSAYGSLRSGEHIPYRDEQHLSPQHFRDSSYDSSGSFERPFSDEGHSGEDNMPVQENYRRHSSALAWRNRENPRFAATFDSSYYNHNGQDREHYRSDGNLNKTDEGREAYNRFRMGDRYSSQDSLDGKQHVGPDGTLATRFTERKASAAHSNPNQFIATKVSPLAKTAEEQLKVVKEIKEIRHKITHDDEEWKSNLSSWKLRRRSQSTTRPPDEDDEDQAAPRKPKTFSEMVQDKSRRASGYFGYSSRNVDEEDADDEAFIPKTDAFLHSMPPKSHRDNSLASTAPAFLSPISSPEKEGQDEEEETESSEESSDDEFIGPQLIHQSKRSTVMLTSAREGHMRLVVNMNLPREEYLEDKGWGLTIKGGKDKALPITIDSVKPDSAASEAGLRVCDEITAINGENIADHNHGYVMLLMNKAANVMGRMEVFIRRECKPGDLPKAMGTPKDKKTPFKPVPARRGPAARKIGQVQQSRLLAEEGNESSPKLPSRVDPSPQAAEEVDGKESGSEKEDDEQELAQSYQNILDQQDSDSRMSTMKSDGAEEIVVQHVETVPLESQPDITADVDPVKNNSELSPVLSRKPKRNWQDNLKATWQEKQDEDFWDSFTNETSVDDVAAANGVSNDDSAAEKEEGSGSFGVVNTAPEEDRFMGHEMAKVEAKIQMQRQANAHRDKNNAFGDSDKSVENISLGAVKDEEPVVMQSSASLHIAPPVRKEAAPPVVESKNNEILVSYNDSGKLESSPVEKSKPVASSQPKSFKSLEQLKSHSLRNKDNKDLESRVAKEFESHVTAQRPSSTSFNRRSFSLDQERKRMEDWTKEQERLRQEKYEQEQKDLQEAYVQRTQQLEKRKQQAKEVQDVKIREVEDVRLREAQRYRDSQKKMLEEQRQRTEQRLKEEAEKREKELERKRIIEEESAKEEEERLQALRKQQEEGEQERRLDVERKEEERRARQRQLNEDRKRALEDQRKKEAEIKKKREEDKQRQLEQEQRQREEDERTKRRERERKNYLWEKEKQLRDQEERLRKEQERLRLEQEHLQKERENQHKLWLQKEEEIRRAAEDADRKQKYITEVMNSSDEQIRSSPTSMEVSSYRLPQQHSPPVKLGTDSPPLKRDDIFQANKKPRSLVQGSSDSPVFMTRQDVLKVNRRVSNIGVKEWESKEDMPSGGSPQPRMQLKKEFVPKPWEPPSRENSPPKQRDPQKKVFPKVAPKPFKNVRAAVEEDDRKARLRDERNMREESPPMSRDDVLKMNRKPPGSTGFERQSSPSTDANGRSGEQEPMEKKDLKSINAVPRPRQIRDDGWIVSATEREKKKEEAKNRRRSDWIKPHEPLTNPYEHWLVQEAERRRIAEKQDRDRQLKVQHDKERQQEMERQEMERQEVERQEWLRRQQKPSKEVSPQLTESRPSPPQEVQPAERPEWLIDATQENPVSKTSAPTSHQKPQEYYTQPPAEFADRFNPSPVAMKNASPVNAQQRSPVMKPSPGGSHNSSSQDEDVLSVSARQLCAYCSKELGRGAAMVIESLNLYYHVNCFRCCVCHSQLSNGNMGADVRVRVSKLHCKNCYSNDEAGIKYSQV